MKKTTFRRKAAANILVLYREAIRENQKNPTKDNWEDVKRGYHLITALGMLDVISEQAQLRAMKMFEDSTAII